MFYDQNYATQQQQQFNPNFPNYPHQMDPYQNFNQQNVNQPNQFNGGMPYQQIYQMPSGPDSK